MNLRLLREPSRNGATLGSLYVDHVWYCWTLEDVERPFKIAGETAIPTGTYKVVLSPSVRFKDVLPEVLNVPGFLGIRIHAGNTSKDTEGCILVGMDRGDAEIYRSRIALAGLLSMFEARKNDTHTLTIERV